MIKFPKVPYRKLYLALFRIIPNITTTTEYIKIQRSVPFKAEDLRGGLIGTDIYEMKTAIPSRVMEKT
jgi:hypothetical protein